MNPRIIRTTDLTPQRWANGRGLTREIHREPATGTAGTAAWRLSLAEIERTGPFSTIPEMDRHLLSAAPVPLQLTIDAVVRALRHTEVVSFSGSAEVVTTAVHGTARALNLMIRRGNGGGLDVLTGDAPLTVSSAFATALVVLDGTVSLAGQRLERYDTLLPGGDETTLALEKATLARVRVTTPTGPDLA